MSNYLIHRQGKRGIYTNFPVQRRHRGRCQHPMRLKIGNTMQEAMERLPAALKVAQAIQKAMDSTPPGKDPTLEKQRWSLANYKNQIFNDKVFIQQGNFEESDTDDKVVDLIRNEDIKPKQITIPTSNHHTWQQLVDEVRRREPNKSEHTLVQFDTRIKQFIEVTKQEYVEACCREDVLKWRDWLQQTRDKNTTFKAYYKMMRRLYQYAHQWGWHDNEPNDLFQNRYVTNVNVENQDDYGLINEKKDLDIKVPDAFFSMRKFSKATDSQKQSIVNWWIMRYTCCHKGEADGIMWEDIDLERRTIKIERNAIRSVKRTQRARELPILDPLYDVLKRYQDETKRYVGSIHGHKKGMKATDLASHISQWMYQQKWGDVTYSPKDARDYGNTVLQSKYGDDRRVSAINGHKQDKGNSTGVYGKITLESKREVLMALLE